MRKLLGITMIFLSVQSIPGSEEASLIGESFPEIRSENLEGDEILLPPRDGKPTLLIVAFRREAQEAIDLWLQGFEENAFRYGPIRFYEVPMLAGPWKIISAIIDGGMRGGIPEEKHKNVVTYYGDLEPYRRALGVRDKSLARVYILDGKGVVRFQALGDPKGGEIKRALELYQELSQK